MSTLLVERHPELATASRADTVVDTTPDITADITADAVVVTFLAVSQALNDDLPPFWD